MHNTSTGILGNEGASNNTEASLSFPVFKEIEERLVRSSDQFLSFESLEHFVLCNLGLLVNVSHSFSLKADVFLVVFEVLELNVVKGRVDSACEVRRKGPGSSSPGNQVGALEFS
jgi:hypothetical protein